MISYRLRGFVNLYIFTAAALNGGFFLLYALASINYITWIGLSAKVNIALYFIAVVLGMMVSARYVSAIGNRFHRISWIDAARLALRQSMVVSLFIFAVVGATKDKSISRVFVSSYLALSWLLMFGVNSILPRALANLAFQRQHRLPTLFIGDERQLRKLSAWIRAMEHLGIYPVGYLSDESQFSADREDGLCFLGGTAALTRVIEDRGIGQVVVLEIPETEVESAKIVEVCQSAGCRLLIYTDIQDRLAIPIMPIVEDGHLFLTVQDEPLEDPMNRAVKRIYDISLALPVVIFVLPLLTIWVWIMQNLQAPGPVFFVRPRGGQRRTEFPMLKFRSMYVATADSNLESRQARPSDERVYPFGRFIRRASIDEFPQFLNVLKGEMSIVGPRPHLPRHDHEFAKVAKAYRSRHLVKPGITGLAQISGLRGEIIDSEMLRKRVELDLKYITTWSMWLDLQITVRTLWQVFFPPKSAF